ncbi:hypothetical protein SAMN02745164_00915 [Marinitoga hydrogenitolerans DSM 16785]|uniref:Uncharacterized protein n=1 Tax=Marinitoga hydrogenitolerans (strain DSM 16785 / JCM 12826 / AT1271) TaxID=1122195 RepID=A0A1M4VFZ6_MARH1|nr:hypothetical protein [Marinitoga hydrogenitolerans]SHE67753.1 hypothetical protein SAMN02745164_00915 [Marinitoga hydrogenitolerans DSM 16785]
MKITKQEEIRPICPYCEKELDEIYVKTKGVGLITGKNAIYFCPHCHKILGVGQSRMA